MNPAEIRGDGSSRGQPQSIPILRHFARYNFSKFPKAVLRATGQHTHFELVIQDFPEGSLKIDAEQINLKWKTKLTWDREKAGSASKMMLFALDQQGYMEVDLNELDQGTDTTFGLFTSLTPDDIQSRRECAWSMVVASFLMGTNSPADLHSLVQKCSPQTCANAAYLLFGPTPSTKHLPHLMQSEACEKFREALQTFKESRGERLVGNPINGRWHSMRQREELKAYEPGRFATRPLVPSSTPTLNTSIYDWGRVKLHVLVSRTDSPALLLEHTVDGRSINMGIDHMHFGRLYEDQSYQLDYSGITNLALAIFRPLDPAVVFYPSQLIFHPSDFTMVFVKGSSFKKPCLAAFFAVNSVLNSQSATVLSGGISKCLPDPCKEHTYYIVEGLVPEHKDVVITDRHCDRIKNIYRHLEEERFRWLRRIY